MYISKAVLNPRRRGARHLLSSPQRMHAAVLSAFSPTEMARSDSGRVLWRLDPGEHHTDLLVVSPGMPDLIDIVDAAGWPATTPAQTKDYSSFLSRVVKGSEWHFRVRANPVNYLRKEGWDRHRRVGHVTAEHQAVWWIDKAAKSGLEVIDPESPSVEPARAADRVCVLERETVRFQRERTAGARPVTLTTAVFEGHVRVTDVEQVRDALVGGIGRARAYGCGLLTLVSVG